MNKKKFNVVFSGHFREARPRDEIERDLSKIFKLGIGTVKSAFGAGSRIVKKDVDRETASALADVLNRAGALCSVEESQEPASTKGNSQKRDTKKAGKIKVVPLEFGSEDISLAPLQCAKITAVDGGINISRAERQEIGYGSIQSISAFRDESYKMLFFTNDSKRPFIADCDTIAFSGFPHVTGSRLTDSLRKFLIYILAKNPNIIVDKNTYEFIRGNPPFVFKGDVLLMTTAIKKALSALGLTPAPHETESSKGIKAGTGSSAKDRQRKVLAQCPKCGVKRNSGQEACVRCGLVFANWGSIEKFEKDTEETAESPSREHEPESIEYLEDSEDHEETFDPETALRQVDAWCEKYTQLFSLVLILGMLLPMIKQGGLYNSVFVIWPWHLIGLAAGDEIQMLFKKISGEGHMVLWFFVPIISGVTGLLSIKYLSGIHRSLVVSILGAAVFVLFTTLFVRESRVLGVMFLPESVSGGISYVLFGVSSGMIAMANHLRKRFRSSHVIRIITLVAGIVLGFSTCVLFIISKGPWQTLPMLILYALLILYAALGIYSAYKNPPDLWILSLISKTARAIVFCAFVAGLLLQAFYPDPSLAYAMTGTGVIQGLGAVLKCALIYLGSAFMMVMGASAIMESILIEKAE